MNRLNFSLPEFTRIAWVSEVAREAWEYRIGAINTAWFEIERSSVVNGLRPGGLQSIEPENLVRFQQWCFDQDVGMAIIGRDGVASIYGNAALPVTPNAPYTYRVYYGNNPLSFSRAWNKDELKVGKLLGYPACCSVFFKAYWTEAGWRDLVYPMVGCAPARITGPFTCNILLRHIGVRATFHLPCSFDCKFTDATGNEILEHGRMMGFTDEMNWITEMLNWPVRWSSLHGVTIITTPVLKIITSSDALAEAVVLDREGKGYPAEGATGTEFPFRQTRALQLQGLEDVWTDNGFSNPFAQRHAHDMILDVIAHLSLVSGRVLDLGCGNGALLQKIKMSYPEVTTVGVDLDEEKCNKAIARGNEVYWDDIVRTERYLIHDYELILVSLNRLKEMNADLFLSRLQKHTRYLLVYSYQDWDDVTASVSESYFEQVSATKAGIVKTHVLRPR